MIKAIETRYAGCRFRSRLEARWAVFFDTLKIEWQYEPQGFMVPMWWNGEGVEPAGQPYLPDFYLPQTETWVEVKGDFDAFDWDLMARAVDWGGALPGIEDSAGTSQGLLLLGPIPPDIPKPSIHPILQHYKGGTINGAFFSSRGPQFNVREFTSEPRNYFDSTWGVPEATDAWVQVIKKYFPGGYCFDGVREDRAVRTAYTAARSARFEHGERG